MLENVPTGHGEAPPLAVPTSQYLPVGHTAGLEVPMPHTYPGRQLLQAIEPTVSAYVPGEQGYGAALPASQKLPAGQIACLGLVDPRSQ